MNKITRSLFLMLGMISLAALAHEERGRHEKSEHHEKHTGRVPPGQPTPPSRPQGGPALSASPSAQQTGQQNKVCSQWPTSPHCPWPYEEK